MLEVEKSAEVLSKESNKLVVWERASDRTLCQPASSSCQQVRLTYSFLPTESNLDASGDE